ncbi:MAG: 50S ribosomal protein L4 [Chloroflexi bacterium]|nr:50S ribosomal protein L4 [Chloroflexota bacterium]
MELPLRNAAGDELGQIEVDNSVFGRPVHQGVIHQALVCQLANMRRGTVDTKTRGEVAGSTHKLFRQKGTGRARQGSVRAPHRRGGGVAFGPHPRDFSQRLPRKMRRLAIKSLLSDKVAESNLVIVDRLSLTNPKTKEMIGILQALGVSGSALLVTDGREETVLQAAHNIPRVKVLQARYLNVVDLLSHRSLVITEAAVRQAESLWGPGGGGEKDADS